MPYFFVGKLMVESLMARFFPKKMVGIGVGPLDTLGNLR